MPEFFHTMRRQFTEDEWRSIRQSGSETEQLKSFYRLWVGQKYMQVPFMVVLTKCIQSDSTTYGIVDFYCPQWLVLDSVFIIIEN